MLNEYDKAQNIIETYDDFADFSGGVTEELISKAEQFLGIEFPYSYKKFLRHNGAGNFGSEEIYGILHGDFESAGIPDAIWFTAKHRKESGLPYKYVIIYFTGDEEYYCLDTSSMNVEHECPIISYVFRNNLQDEKEKIVAQTFGHFFLDIVSREVGV